MKKVLIKYYHIVLLISLFTNIVMCSGAQTIKGTFAIKNVETGIYIRIKGANSANKTPIVAYDPVNWKCVTWNFVQVENNIYQLKNLFSGKTFQPATSAAENVGLEEQPIAPDNASQQYEFITVGENTYLIKLKGTDLYITPSDKKGTTNTPIILSKKNGSKLQQWTLKEQHPEI